MFYSIGEVSRMFNIPVSSLRYYDKVGLFPFIKKTDAGIRQFSDQDLNTLRLIEYLKKAGMQLKDIKVFMDWCLEGDSTLEKRLNVFIEQEKNIRHKIDELKNILDLIEFKKWYYEEAVKDGNENRVKNMRTDDMPDKIKKLYKNTHCNFS